MSYHFFAYLSRMRYIGRWSLMRNAMDENIQEHSHMVAVIAQALGFIRRDIFHQPCDVDRLVSVALYHDCSEILTGDLPTPIKYHSPQILEAYRQVEEIANERLLDTLPAELRGSYEDLIKGESSRDHHQLVKAADKLSAYIKCVEERRAGNDEFRSAERQIEAQLRASPLPELKYFLEHFMPSFQLDLDQLGTIDSV